MDFASTWLFLKLLPPQILPDIQESGLAPEISALISEISYYMKGPSDRDQLKIGPVAGITSHPIPFQAEPSVF